MVLALVCEMACGLATTADWSLVTQEDALGVSSEPGGQGS